MAEFILIHGGRHGAWCWALLEAELHKRGHRTYAMDLPIDQPGIAIDGYVKSVLDFVAGKAADDAFVVGHSMGGLVAPRVALARPKARIIFLCAGFAHTSEAEQQENFAAADPSYFQSLTVDARGLATLPDALSIDAFYHDVPRDLALWAVSKLRPQWQAAYADVPPIAPYRERVAAIVDCADDRVVIGERHAKLARARFGIAPTLLPGSHSPFLSRPAALAQAFDDIVGR